jgi:hypothetical protein
VACIAVRAVRTGASGIEGVPPVEVTRSVVRATIVARAGANVSITAEMAASRNRLRRDSRDPAAFAGSGAQRFISCEP